MRPVDQMNHERPREELAGVRVSRQLQVETGLLGQRRDLRIVRQEQTEGRPCGAVGGQVRTGPRVGIGHSRGEVNHAADQQVCRATRDGDVGVAEHAKPHRLEVRRPRRRPRVVVVVAEHEERPVPGRQRLERRHVARQPRHRSVHDVAGQRDEIRRQLPSHVDDPLDVCQAHPRHGVQIADGLHDPESCRDPAPAPLREYRRDGRRGPAARPARRRRPRPARPPEPTPRPTRRATGAPPRAAAPQLSPAGARRVPPSARGES